MKRVFAIVITTAIIGIGNLFAWGRVGHEIIIEVAKRHITEKTKANIAKYMPYDITKDAVWMDTHRHDKPIAYTTSWHVYNVDEQFEYDMNPRIHKGDVIHAMKVADHNLSKLERLTDSAIVMNIRCLIHFAGDMHCPTHSEVPGPRTFWPCEYNGKRCKSFHSFYDHLPDMLYPNRPSADVAAEIDNASNGEIKRIQKGTLHEWARENAKKNAIIYKWNPHNTAILAPNTAELSHELVDLQMRNAGYRLAYLLNKYFNN